MAALYKKRKFRMFSKSDPKKRIRNRMYYRKNRAKIRAKRRLWRLRNKAHIRLQRQVHTVTPLWYRHKAPEPIMPGRAVKPVRAVTLGAPAARKIRPPRLSRGLRKI